MSSYWNYFWTFNYHTKQHLVQYYGETLMESAGYLFGPVWTILYLLMAISLWLVWKSNSDETRKLEAMLFFAFQLFLNFWWSILFFKFHSPIAAFNEIILMIVLILITIFRFSKISTTAAWLLVPYISWVCFAAFLNYNLWKLNS